MDSNDGQALPSAEADGGGANTNEDVFERLDDFVAIEDRSPPVFFAGRVGVLEACERVLSITAKSRPEGLTRLIHGPPGMGKTALASELMRKVQGKTIHGRPVLCARLPCGTLSVRPLTFVQALNNALWDTHHTLSSGVIERFLGRTAREGLSVAAGILHRPSEHELAIRMKGLGQDSTLSDCLNQYARLMMPDATIALVFDEVQNARITDTAKENLDVLHNRLHDARIATFCFGLPDSPKVLDTLKVSRPSDKADIPLGCLSPSESRQVVDGTFHVLGMDWKNPQWREAIIAAGGGGGDWTSWQREVGRGILERSGNFPQHLTIGLQAACLVVLEEKGAFLGEPAKRRIRTLHDEGRARYYARQALSLGLHGQSVFFGALFARLHETGIESIPKEDVASTLGRRMGDDRMAEDVVDTAIRKGVAGGIVVDGNEEVSFPPIPSMEAHLRGQYEQGLRQGRRTALQSRDSLRSLLAQAPAPSSPKRNSRRSPSGPGGI